MIFVYVSYEWEDLVLTALTAGQVEIVEYVSSVELFQSDLSVKATTVNRQIHVVGLSV